MEDLNGKVAVVTGAASGIGRALAERFASEGMKLVLADIDSESLDEAAGTISQSAGNVVAIPTDVRKPEAMASLLAKSLDEFGAVHVLCNNAGIGGAIAWTWDQPLEKWEQVLGVHLHGVIHGIRTFVPHMLRHNTEGHIVNVASIGGMMSLPFFAPYHATKHAVVTLSESLQFELAMLKANIHVSVLCPGFMRTQIAGTLQDRRCGLPSKFSAWETEPRAWCRAWDELLSAAPPPSEITPQVVDAIRNERFYILPTPDTEALVPARMQTILDGRTPELALPPEVSAMIDAARDADQGLRKS